VRCDLGVILGVRWDSGECGGILEGGVEFWRRCVLLGVGGILRLAGLFKHMWDSNSGLGFYE
jgi:hypothetical protein